ncbi:hypothetical protein KPN8_265 [Klebsiella phage KPN8]|nr:hypothetical protein KPN8_265 [Klebsiella phage KPN8]WPH68800.1 hypothetical protein [Stenotrophomonas phage BUCTxx100]
MSDNQNGNNWEQTVLNTAAGKGEPIVSASAENFGSQLLGLLGQASLLGSSKNVPEVEETAALIKKRVTDLKNGTPGETQKKILPEVNIITKPIISALPGIVLSLHMNNNPAVYVMPVLFSNRHLTNTLEEIQIDNGVNQQRKMSMPFTPDSYARADLFEQIKMHYKAMLQDKGVSECVIINVMVIDLEQIVGDDVLNQGKSPLLRDEIMRSWEQGLMVQIAKIAANQPKASLPSPFSATGGKAYGQHGNAIARVEPIRGQYVNEGLLSPANLTIRMQTANHNGYQGNAEQSREIVNTYATVSLMGSPIQQFNPQLTGNIPQPYLQTPNGRPQGYTPLQPVVIMNHAKAGEVLGDATGLSTYFMGLFSLMATNSNYLFAEALRSKNVGSRGSLTDMEHRIRQMENGLPPRTKGTEMTDAKLSDIDFTTNWIRANIGPKAVFAADLIQFGPDAAISNFLFNLTSGAKDYSKCVKTVIAIVDSISGDAKAMSAVIAENQANNNGNGGWIPGKPVLHVSNALIPVGTAVLDNKRIALGEVDEMFLSKHYKDQITPMNQYLENMYGSNPNVPEKLRRYNLLIQLSTIFSEGVNLFGFARRCYWDPLFMDAFTKAMNTIGSLQVTGSMGQFAANVQVFAPGQQYISQATAGNSGGVVLGNGMMLGAGGGLVFGPSY